MKTLLIAAALLVTVPVSAQEVKLHGYPGKDSYASPAEMPKLDDAQIHWDDITIPGIQSPDESQHAHLGLVGCPKYGEVSGPFTCGIVIKIFNTTARVGRIYTQMVKSIVWDETGSTQQPVMQGTLGHGAEGTRAWTGTVTFDPALSKGKHGWASPFLSASVRFPDGRTGFVAQYYPFFLMVDPSVPEFNSRPVWRASCQIDSNHGANYGDTLIESGDFDQPHMFWPVAPLKAHTPWLVDSGSNGYGSPNLPPAVWNLRRDLDYHQHNVGVLMREKTQTGAINSLITLDPDAMGPGDHRVANIRFQQDGDEQIACLQVSVVTAEADVQPPPPALCTDPTATNSGQPLPCVFPPPPPPPPVFTVFTFTCDAAGKCQLVVK